MVYFCLNKGIYKVLYKVSSRANRRISSVSMFCVFEILLLVRLLLEVYFDIFPLTGPVGDVMLLHKIT